MDERPQSATVDLKVRMKEPLRAKLEGAAKAHGVSMNAETVARLERSFSGESAVQATLEAALGGPEMRQLVLSMVAAFASASEFAAHGKEHPEWTAQQRLKDPDCYQAGMFAVMEALLRKMPGADLQGLAHQVEHLKSRIVTGFFRGDDAAPATEEADR